MRRGFFSPSDVVMILAIVIGFLMIGVALIDLYFENYSKDDACENLNFRESYQSDIFDFCKDYQGNFYYVNFDCEGFWFNKECTAKEISVGDVRVVAR